MVLPAEADVDDIQATTDAVHDAIARVHLGADDAMLADLRRLRAVTRRLELGEEVGPDELAAAATALADVDVTDAYLREVRAGGGSPGCLGGAAASLVEGRARAAACYLQAVDARYRDDAAGGEAHLREALAADDDYQPALVDAAQVAEMRGDAPRALRLLGGAGREDSDQAARLRGYTTGVRAGRNDPCPCGSGRKTKRCCGDRPGGGLPRRAAWLLEKVYVFTDDATMDQRLRERLGRRSASPTGWTTAPPIPWWRTWRSSIWG